MFHWLRQRTSSMGGWHATTGCILASAVTVALVAPYGFLGSYLIRHPELAPYFDLTFATNVGLPFVWIYTAICLGILIAALAVRRRNPDCRPLVYVTCVTICLNSGLFVSWMFGQFTSPLVAALFVGIAATGLVLFDWRPMAWGMGLWVFGLIVLSTVQQLGYVRYAPLFVDSPAHDGHLSSLWLVGPGGATTVVVLGLTWLITDIVGRWRSHEAQLQETSDELARANDIISRYVAHQLIDQIRSGDYEAAERHERRKLTLFFSDIENFTAVSERLEPEDLSEVLNEYLSEMTVIGERHGATIDKFIGDAIMMFFGAPVATNDHDHALRAVQMAVEMQRRMKELRDAWIRAGIDHPFLVRIGINTGQASIGNFGSKQRMDYTAIGRQVNLAARLQASCEPGGVLISHTTYTLMDGAVPCTPRGEIHVKGFEHPVRVYAVDVEPAPPTGSPPSSSRQSGRPGHLAPD